MTGKRFEFGKVYWATPVFHGAPKRCVIMIGRSQGSIQFAFVEDLSSADVDQMIDAGIGREFCRIRGREHDYNCSCAAEVPAADAAMVYSAILSRKSQQKD